MHGTALKIIESKAQERINNIHFHLNTVYENLLRIPPTGSKEAVLARGKAIQSLVKIRVQLGMLGLIHKEGA